MNLKLPAQLLQTAKVVLMVGRLQGPLGRALAVVYLDTRVYIVKLQKCAK